MDIILCHLLLAFYAVQLLLSVESALHSFTATGQTRHLTSFVPIVEKPRLVADSASFNSKSCIGHEVNPMRHRMADLKQDCSLLNKTVVPSVQSRCHIKHKLAVIIVGIVVVEDL